MNKQNSYAQIFEHYDKIPKAVFAAVVASFLLIRNDDNEENIEVQFFNEWSILNANGIVPQKPPKTDLCSSNVGDYSAFEKL